MLGGAPAKVIGCGFKRVFSPHYENTIIHWFNEHPRENFYYVEQFSDDIDDIKFEF